MAVPTPTENERDFRMMFSPDNWPQYPVLPLKRGDGFPREHCLIYDNLGTGYLIPNKTMMQSIMRSDIKRENLLTEELARQLVNDGWQVD